MGRFIGFYKRLTGQCEDGLEECLQQRRNVLFSRFLLTAIAVVLVHTIQDLLAQLWIGSSINILILLVLVGSLYFIQIGYHRSSKTVLIVFANCILLIYCSLIPRANGVFLFFFPVIAVASVAFDPDQKKFRYSLVGLSIVCLMLLVLTDFKVFGEVSIPAETERASLLINITSSSFLLIVCIDFMSRTNEESEMRLRAMAHEVQDKNHDLQKTNTELDRFLYSTSHDLRAPVSSIKGLIMIALKESREVEIQKYLSMMYDRTEKLDQFIHEILNYSRNARTEVKTEPVNFKSLLMEVADSFKFFEGAENISIHVDADERIIHADILRLRVILNNLVSNAVKYHDSAKVNPYVGISVKYGKTNLILTISDNGIGIDDQAKEKIFEMFYRGTDRSKGSGLGLYIVKEVVERLQGKIQVNSTLGSGTQFIITLPVKYEMPSSLNEPAAVPVMVTNLYSTAEAV